MTEAGKRTPPNIRRSFQWKNGNFVSAAVCLWTSLRTLSSDYCRYCYQDGAFTAPDATMEDMIAFNLKFNAENGFPFGPQEEAERNMRSWFPALKRWKNA